MKGQGLGLCLQARDKGGMRFLPRLLLLILLVLALLPWGGYRAAVAGVADAPRIEAAQPVSIGALIRCHGPALVCADHVTLTATVPGPVRREGASLAPGGAWLGTGIEPAHLTGPPRIG